MPMVRVEIEFDVTDAELSGLGVKGDNAQRVTAAEAFERAVRERVFGQGFLPAGIKLSGSPSIRFETRDAETE